MAKISSLDLVGDDIAPAIKGEAPAGRRKVEKADKTLLIGIDVVLWKRLKAMALEREMFLKDVVIEILTEATEGK
jgi:macrodomain Ter protein organizer (MatP/YcbG family)